VRLSTFRPSADGATHAKVRCQRPGWIRSVYALLMVIRGLGVAKNVMCWSAALVVTLTTPAEADLPNNVLCGHSALPPGRDRRDP